PAGFRAPAPPVSTATNHPTVPVNPIGRRPLPMGVVNDATGTRAGVEGGRPGRMVTNVPVHGGTLQGGRSMNRGTMGPHGTMMGPRGSIARSPAMTAPRMGGERMGGYGGYRSIGPAPSAGSSHPASTSSTPHH